MDSRLYFLQLEYLISCNAQVLEIINRGAAEVTVERQEQCCGKPGEICPCSLKTAEYEKSRPKPGILNKFIISRSFTPRDSARRAFQPTASTSGAFQPKASTSGAFQPTTSTSSAFQPTASTTSTFQPTASKSGLFQPPASAGGLFQPTASTSCTFQPTPSTGGLSQPTASTGSLSEQTASNDGAFLPPTSTGGLFQPPSSAGGLFHPTTSSGGIFQPTAYSSSEPQPTATHSHQQEAIHTNQQQDKYIFTGSTCSLENFAVAKHVMQLVSSPNTLSLLSTEFVFEDAVAEFIRFMLFIQHYPEPGKSQLATLIFPITIYLYFLMMQADDCGVDGARTFLNGHANVFRHAKNYKKVMDVLLKFDSIEEFKHNKRFQDFIERKLVVKLSSDVFQNLQAFLFGSKRKMGDSVLLMVLSLYVEFVDSDLDYCDADGDANKGEESKGGTNEDGGSKNCANEDGVSKGGTNKHGGSKDGAKKDGGSKGGAIKGRRSMGGAIKDGGSKVGAIKGRRSKGGAIKDGGSKGGENKEGRSKGDGNKDGRSKSDANKDERSKSDANKAGSGKDDKDVVDIVEKEKSNDMDPELKNIDIIKVIIKPQNDRKSIINYDLDSEEMVVVEDVTEYMAAKTKEKATKRKVARRARTHFTSRKASKAARAKLAKKKKKEKPLLGKERKEVPNPHLRSVSSVDFNPAFTELAFAIGDTFIYTLAIVEPKEEDKKAVNFTKETTVFLRTLNFNKSNLKSTSVPESGNVYVVKYLPSDPLDEASNFNLLVACSLKVILFATKTCTVLAEYNIESSHVFDIDIDPTKQYFATANHHSSAYVYAFCHSARLCLLTGHENAVTAVKFHPNGIYVATGSDDCTVRLFEVESGLCVRLFVDLYFGVTVMDFSYDGSLIAAGDTSGMVRIWDIKECNEKSIMAWRMPEEITNVIGSLCFHEKTSVLAASNQKNEVKFWDIRNPSQKHIVRCVHEVLAVKRVKGKSWVLILMPSAEETKKELSKKHRRKKHKSPRGGPLSLL